MEPANTSAVDEKTAAPDPQGPWHAVGSFRRIVLLGLIVAQTYIATNFMVAVLPYHGQQPLEVVMLVLFAILFAWVSGGFWTAIAGFVLQLLGGDRFAISRTAAADAPLDANARTAIVMPIRNENVARVFAGLRATYDSLAHTGELAHFDFFLLSDTSDPDIRVAETSAWHALCLSSDAFGHVFYRWRRHRIKRKSGNIADFCRRWGRNYRYMVVLDADSVMSGECLTRLVRLMEANPGAGIIQTAPRAAGRDTMYARVQQFANRVYGPLFTAGLHFWQLGESHYWGHNAIIRVAPFMRYCGLRRLPGRGSLSGEILSHDFVEAALMRRAGWAVWIAYDLRGSYEEMPPNLVDAFSKLIINSVSCTSSFEQMAAPNRYINTAVQQCRLARPNWNQETRASLNEAAQTVWGRLFLRDMPAFRGVLERLQENPESKLLPVVVLTARRLSTAERELLRERTVSLLEKGA